MPLDFTIAADNSQLLRSLQEAKGELRKFVDFAVKTGLEYDEIQKSAKNAFDAVNALSKNFDMSTPEKQMAALATVIRDNELALRQSAIMLRKWKDDMREAQAAGNEGTFNAISKDVEEETQRMMQLLQETQKYSAALQEIKAANGISTQTGGIAPMLFSSQEEYAQYDSLKAKVQAIKDEMATVGDTEGFNALRQSLFQTEEQLRAVEMSATEAAAKLGEGGERAADASVNYYELGKAIDAQQNYINNLLLKMNEYAQAMEDAQKAGDADKLSESTEQYDILAQEVQKAKVQLIGMTTEQERYKEAMSVDPTESVRKQMRDLTQEIMSLTLQYRQMSAEERKSAKGEALKRKLDELKDKAGELRDAMGDVNREVNAIASDTSSFDALGQGLNVITSSFGAAAGVAAMFGVEQENILDIQAKIQASLAISNALTVVGNALQKESSLMIKIGTIQRKAAAAAENAKAAAEARGVATTKAATVAQRIFNAVAKANPYVLLATAIVAVVGALAAFAAWTSKSKKEEEERQKRMERQKEIEDEYYNSLNSNLAEAISSYRKMQYEWKNLSSAQEKNKWLDTNKEKYHALGVELKNINDADNYFNKNSTKVVAAMMQRAKAAAYAAKVTKIYQDALDNAPKEGDVISPEQAQQYRKAGLKFSKEVRGMFGGTKGYKLTKEESEAAGRISLISADTKAKAALEEIQKLNESEEKILSSAGIKQYDDKKSKSGATKSKAKEREKMTELYLKQKKDASAKERAMDAENRKLDIELEEDWSKKRLKVISDNYQKEQEEIEKWWNELAEKRVAAAKSLWSADERNKDKNFYESQAYNTALAGYSDEEQALLDKKQEAARKKQKEALEELDKERLQSMLDYLKEYGSVEEQRLAITREYEKKIQEAHTETERMRLERERDSALSSVTAQSLAGGIDWSLTFEGIGNVMEEVAKTTLKRINDYMKTDEFKSLSADEKASYLELRERVKQAGGVDASSVFSTKTWEDIGTAVEDYKESLKRLDEANIKAKEAREALTKAEENVRKDPKSIDKAIALTDAESNFKLAVQEQTDANNEVTEAQTALRDKTEQANQGLQNFETTLGQITSGSLSGFALGVGNIIRSIKGTGKAAESVTELFGEAGIKVGGIIGAIMQIVDVLGDDPEKFINDLFTKVATVIEAVFSQLPDIMMAAMKGSLKIGEGVMNGIGNLIFGGENNAPYKKALDKWGWVLDQWKATIDYQKKMIDKSYGVDVLSAKEKSETTLEQARAAARAMWTGWAESGASWNSKSHGRKQRKGTKWDLLREYDPELAAQIDGWTLNLFDLSPERLEELKSNAGEFWASLGEMTTKYLDVVIETGKEAEAIHEEVLAQLTTTTSEDVFKGFLDQLAELADGADDVFEGIAEDWQKMVNRMVVNNLVGVRFQEALKGWYDRLAETTEQRYKDEIGDVAFQDRLDELKEEYNQYVRDAQNTIKTFRDMGIVQETESYKQEATSKGFQAMGQDTAEELNGRFTALQIAGESVAASVISVTEQLYAITALHTSSNNYLQDMRNMMITSTTYLDDIAKYSKKMYNDFGLKLDSVINNTK